jgi:uncharacterized membrane protein SpoIIM required for sporulation
MNNNKMWFGIFLLLLLILGFLIAVFLRNPLIIYLVTIISGIISGKIFHERKHKDPFIPAIFILIIFLAGFIVGNFSASRILTLVLFLASMVATHFAYQKKLVGKFKNDDFVK